ncbi:S1C family serine protease [Streptomyces sp. Vc74B-19]|uniref:S1C family serine protease n=1 Tax=Streptomyces sp. Vc74B-19 TaxID=2741324 RepID=UPI00203D847A|nr:S1C family serine protease [Streptomyces sp. Vc74B-19]
MPSLDRFRGEPALQGGHALERLRGTDPGLVALHDLAGRPRGTGFVADRHGTVITSHETVDGLPRLVLHGADGRHSIVTADAVTPLPGLGLALVRGGDLGIAPLPVTSRGTVRTGAYVRIPAGGWREARVLGTASVTYTATDRTHRVHGALELAVGTAGRDALRLGGGAAGGPVLDPATGTVVGVLGTALRTAASDVGFAVPLRPTAPALAALLVENAATVPAYGTDLNLAGLVGLTAASVALHAPSTPVAPVERHAVRARLHAIERGTAAVLGLVGPPGSGRSTELAALADRRHREGLPTLWLRGADLRADDTSVADAARRALERAAAEVVARMPFPPQDVGDLAPERLARLAHSAGRPLLLLLDDPEHMPSDLFRRRAAWTEGTMRWLAETGARLLVSCGAEYAEEAGLPAVPPQQGGAGPDGLPPFAYIGDLTADEAREARARLGIPEGALTDADAAHPLTLRMLAEVRSDLAGAAPEGPADRDGVLTAHLDLTCLRIARRLAGGTDARGTAVRRLAARAAGKAHEAARHCLGTEDGALDRETFEALFPGAGDAAGPGTGPRGHCEPAGRADVGPSGRSGTGQHRQGEPAGWSEAGYAAGAGTDRHRHAEPAGCADAVFAAGPGTEPHRHGEPAGWSEAVFAGRSGTGPDRRGEQTGWADARYAADSGTGPDGRGELAGWADARYAAGTGPGRHGGSVVGAEALLAAGSDTSPHRLGELAGRAAAGYAAGPGSGRDRHGEPVGRAGVGYAAGSGIGSDRQGESAGWSGAGYAAGSGAGPDRHGEPVGRAGVGYAAGFGIGSDRQGESAGWSEAGYAAGFGAGPDRHGEPAGRAGVGYAAGFGIGSDRQGESAGWSEAGYAAGFGAGPARHDEPVGWAEAVLVEGLLVPAGDGYRFAHQELADWLQGGHLDLDGALHTLVHAPAADTGPVPRHRIGPVVQALLSLARRHGAARLASRLADLTHALDADPGSWWAARLLTGTLARVPDAGPYTDVLRLLADRVVAWREQRRTVPDELGPAFWTALRLPVETRCALLRRLVLADGPPCESGPRFLDAAAALLTADPVTVLPYLVRWFDDERPLPATPHATVATAAQALLHTHRHAAPDALTEALVDSTHRRADELLTVLAEEEPGAMCRAVDRWAEDPRPARRAAAVTHGLRVAPYARDLGDRTLLRYAALAVLVRTADRALHGGALALLVRDPNSRDRHLARALDRFAAGDPHFPPSALTDALTTHPEPVLDAFRTRLAQGADADETVRALGDAATPALARPVAAVVREAVVRRPELTGCVAGYADRRLDLGPAARAVLRLLLTELLDDGPQPLRLALADVLAAPGTSASRPLRRALLDTLLAQETDAGVLDAVLRAAARNTGPELRVLVHRTALLLVRTPEGAARFDLALADLARHVPGLAAAVAGWLTDAPHVWGPLVGAGTREVIDELTGVVAPV